MGDSIWEKHVDNYFWSYATRWLASVMLIATVIQLSRESLDFLSDILKCITGFYFCCGRFFIFFFYRNKANELLALILECISSVIIQFSSVTQSSLPALVIWDIFDDSRSDRFEVISHCFLICIALMISSAEHRFMCLLIISVSSLEKWVFRFSAHFNVILNGSNVNFSLFSLLI